MTGTQKYPQGLAPHHGCVVDQLASHCNTTLPSLEPARSAALLAVQLLPAVVHLRVSGAPVWGVRMPSANLAFYTRFCYAGMARNVPLSTLDPMLQAHDEAEGAQRVTEEVEGLIAAAAESFQLVSGARAVVMSLSVPLSWYQVGRLRVQIAPIILRACEHGS